MAYNKEVFLEVLGKKIARYPEWLKKELMTEPIEEFEKISGVNK